MSCLGHILSDKVVKADPEKGQSNNRHANANEQCTELQRFLEMLIQKREKQE